MIEKLLSQISFIDDIEDTNYVYEIKVKGKTYFKGKIDLRRFKPALERILQDDGQGNANR